MHVNMQLHRNRSQQHLIEASSEQAIILSSALIIVTANADARVDNIMTQIRLFEGVATVSQVTAVVKHDVMHRSIELLVKFNNDYTSMDLDEYLKLLHKKVLAISTVYSAAVKMLNDRLLDLVLAKKREVTAVRYK